MSNENILTIRIMNNFCGDFYVTMKEEDTLKDLITAVREGFIARGTTIDKFCGPLDYPMNLTLKEMKLESLKFDLMSSRKYQSNKKVEPKEYVDTKVKNQKLAKPNETIETRLKTGKQMKCHVCGKHNAIVYLCPRNEFHRFCSDCINQEGISKMEKSHACDICRGICECQSCNN